jgi:serine/threonine protein kinase
MTTSRHLYSAGDEPAAGSGYRLSAFLGSGAFGQVWRASGPGGTAVALKIVDLGDRKAYKELRALTVIKQLQHPHLVPVFGFWLKDADSRLLDEHDIEEVARQGTQVKPGGTGTVPVASGSMSLGGSTVPIASGTMVVPRYRPPLQLIIAMGLGHKSLTERLEECQAEGLPGIPSGELLRYMDGVARALDHLAKPRTDGGVVVGGVQHGDIKPSNVLIVGDAAQVCDFGLARVLTDNRQTSLAGSPIYMAPEMFAQTTPSAAGDQYSLAITYYELRTGQLPMPDEAAANWMEVWKIHSEGRLDLSLLEAAERSAIARATSVNPAERFASCCELVAALREAIEYRPPPPAIVAGGPVDTPRTRRRSFVTLGGLLAVIACGVWGGAKLGPRWQNDGALQDVPVPRAREIKIARLKPVTIRAGDEPHALPVQISFNGLDESEPVVLRVMGQRPAGVYAEVDPEEPLIKLWADVTTAPQVAMLTLEAVAGEVKCETPLELQVAAVEPRLPPGCRVAAGSGYQKVGGEWYADRIEYVADDLTVAFLLINNDNPPRFYIMEDKVTNGLYQWFARLDPKAAGDTWIIGSGLGRADDAEHAPMPVLNVTWQQAALFAARLGGRLPTVSQWEAVAKRSDEDGYLRKLADNVRVEVAIGRADGPQAVGEAADDRTPSGGHDRSGQAYYVRDMWGNGYEWTRETTEGDEMTLATEDPATMKLRALNWQAPNPLGPHEQSIEYQWSPSPKSQTGFRVVIDEWP